MWPLISRAKCKARTLDDVVCPALVDRAFFRRDQAAGPSERHQNVRGEAMS